MNGLESYKNYGMEYFIATTQGAGLGITGTVADTTNYVTRKKYDPSCRIHEKYLLLLG